MTSPRRSGGASSCRSPPRSRSFTLIIQAAFVWTDAHLHPFEIGGLRYGDTTAGTPDEPEDFGNTFEASDVRLRDFSRKPGTAFAYIYADLQPQDKTLAANAFFLARERHHCRVYNLLFASPETQHVNSNLERFTTGL
jgi:Plasmid pRiA4b ORF-3-like protein